MSAPTCPLVHAFEPDRWHIAGPVWAVRMRWSKVWVLLQYNDDGGYETVSMVGHPTRRAAVRAYWDLRKLGRP
jgi:hypothetical protein